MVNDDKWEGRERKERMDAAELRISRTPSGEQWLDRVLKIARPDWTKSDSQTGESRGAKDFQNSESSNAGDRR